MIAHAEVPGKILQGFTMSFHGQAAMQAQRLSRDTVGDIRVAIPVAAHPGGKTEPGSGRFQARIMSCQRVFQVIVNGRQGIPENRAHKIQAGPHFVGDRQAGRTVAIRQPERYDLGTD